MLRGSAAFAIALLVCAGPAAFGQPSGPQVRIVDFDFAPKELTIDVNATVTFTNTGARPHTVTDRGGTFDTNPIAPKASSTVTFGVPGRYLFFCRINPSKMNGAIVVRPDAQAPRVTRVQAVDPGREGEALRFDPPEITIATGSTVLFANVGGKPHTLTADDGSFDTGVVTPGAEGGRFAGSNATLTVTKPGRHPFHCEVHPQAMKGVLVATGQEQAGPSAASSAPRKGSVSVVDFAFQPAQLSVAPGAEVTWSNRGQATHTATFDDEPLDANEMKPGASATVRAPSKPGSYSYRCNIHPARMRAVLVVVGQNAADPVRRASSGPAGQTSPRAGAVTPLALATGVFGAFLGGFGISAFVRNNMGG